MMRKSLHAAMVAAVILPLLAGCAGLRKAPVFESQVISTQSALRLDVALSDRSTTSLLVGAAAETEEPQGSAGKVQAAFASAPARTPVARVSYGHADEGETAPTPVVEFGWIYVVRPPGWPVVRTPASRGGVPMGMEWHGTVRVAAAIDGDVQRIFFLGAFHADGSPRDAFLRVDDYPEHVSSPAAVDLAVGQYAEARVIGATLQISVGEFPVTDPRCPAEIRDLLKRIREDALDHLMPWNDALVIP